MNTDINTIELMENIEQATEWLRSIQHLLNVTEIAKYIGFDRSNLTKALAGKVNQSTGYSVKIPVKALPKLTELREYLYSVPAFPEGVAVEAGVPIKAG